MIKQARPRNIFPRRETPGEAQEAVKAGPTISRLAQVGPASIFRPSMLFDIATRTPLPPCILEQKSPRGASTQTN